MSGVGERPASSPRELARISDRMSFVYLERCTVHRDANAITAQDADGTKHIPSATIGTLLLGPGTRITHEAMSVLSDTGGAVAWVGAQGVRYYAGGRSLSRSSAMAEAHAACWVNRHSRLDVARAMYRLRFPDDDPAGTDIDIDRVTLRSDRDADVESGVNYGFEDTWRPSSF